MITDVSAPFRTESAVHNDIVGPEGVYQCRAAVLAIGDFDVVRCFDFLVLECAYELCIVSDHDDVRALKMHLTIVVAIQTISFAEKLRMADFRIQLGGFIATLSTHLVDHALTATDGKLIAAVILPTVPSDTFFRALD
jgi:hypothetical protein